MSLEKVCVLILNYQSYEDTIEYINLLQKQKNIELSILVVDNDSPNDSFNILAHELKIYSNVTVIKSEKNGGYAYGNNYGLKYIENRKFEYVIISNNDIFIDDDKLVYKLIQEYTKLEAPAFIAPSMQINGKRAKNSAWRIPSIKDDIYFTLRLSRLFLSTNILYNLDKYSTLKVDCLQGSFFMSRKNTFYNIGLFDEATFLYGEERILAYKVKQNNLQNYLIQNLEYEHINSKTISNEIISSKMKEYLFESRYYFQKSYMHTSKYLLLLFKLVYIFSIFENKLVNLIRKII